ncbi:hypothetical protein RR46_02224 [Papilio xuthus]|uniref:Uncharacterized protein n=1 Tax=Papilio xuthus TaxID=66420 RepID=A0A194QJJ7_PAPXU|nr:hypothetical protein RR46_02224 [Papilio xuthus]
MRGMRLCTSPSVLRAAGTVPCGTPDLETRPDYPLNPAVFTYAQPDLIKTSLITINVRGTSQNGDEDIRLCIV